MRNTVYLLLASVLCVAAYVAAFAVKRHLSPAAIVLTEGAWLLVVFVPIVGVVLVWLNQRGVFTLDASVSVFVIFLLSAFCFNLTVPAIVDRSVTVYLLNSLDNSNDGMTEQEIQREFMHTYFDENYAVRKRLREQVDSGNVRYDGDRYHVTKDGRTIMTTVRFLSMLYNLDPRIVEKKTLDGRAAMAGTGDRGSGEVTAFRGTVRCRAMAFIIYPPPPTQPHDPPIPSQSLSPFGLDSLRNQVDVGTSSC